MDSQQLSTQAAPDHFGSSVSYPVSFSGSGDEYFRIWIVNVLLSVLTLGIYSAWAKVRKQQYFLRNTQLAGFAFDYHGSPKAILIGRLIVFGVLFLFQVAGAVHPLMSLLLLPALLILPWVLVRSLRFRARNISYRGLRFNFQGRTKEAVVLGLKYLLVPLTAGLLFPKWHRDLKYFVLNNARFGTTPFRFTATARMFYGVYGRMFLILLLLVFAIGMLGVLLGVIPLLALLVGGVFVLFVPLLYVFAGAMYSALMQNLIWNHLQLGEHRFVSTTTIMSWFKFLVPNVLLLVLSVGLYYPYFSVKMWAFRLSSIQMVSDGDLDGFLGERVQDTSAFGEEVADWFDFDIAV